MPIQTETVASFSKGLMVLTSFGAERRRQTITEVAQRTGLTRAGARRFLLTLCDAGYARTDGKHFELTAKVLELGNAYITGMSELETIREILQDLTRDLGESTSASTLDDADVIYLARAHARHRVMTIGANVGTRLPAHATSMGHVLLAQLSHNELARFFQLSPLAAFTPTTLTTREALKARLAQVREQGYAHVCDELESGLRAIAVPIQGRPANARLAINLSAHASRMSEAEMVTNCLEPLRRAARRIEMLASR